ncbi:hypothetical protein MKZ15_05665 [Paenibacillus sp. FSL R7-0216]|uniref:hypothetical protein n=1 Tax=Paenibacillus sp. FSL R7-0216 TaxID=2921677 RepID=UPI0030DBEA4C
MLYEVGVRWERERKLIEAKNSTLAKREFCKRTGRKYDDPWSGVSILTARQKDANPAQKGRIPDVTE